MVEGWEGTVKEVRVWRKAEDWRWGAGEPRVGELRSELCFDAFADESRDPLADESLEPLPLLPGDPITASLRKSHTRICAGRMARLERTCCSSLSWSSRKVEKGPAGIVEWVE